MLKIGDFSKMSKVTIKALRYYEKEVLLIPKYVDKFNKLVKIFNMLLSEYLD